MGRITRLTERDLTRLVRRVIREEYDLGLPHPNKTVYKELFNRKLSEAMSEVGTDSEAIYDSLCLKLKDIMENWRYESGEGNTHVWGDDENQSQIFETKSFIESKIDNGKITSKIKNELGREVSSGNFDLQIGSGSGLIIKHPDFDNNKKQIKISMNGPEGFSDMSGIPNKGSWSINGTYLTLKK